PAAPSSPSLAVGRRAPQPPLPARRLGFAEPPPASCEPPENPAAAGSPAEAPPLLPAAFPVVSAPSPACSTPRRTRRRSGSPPAAPQPHSRSRPVARASLQACSEYPPGWDPAAPLCGIPQWPRVADLSASTRVRDHSAALGPVEQA